MIFHDAMIVNVAQRDQVVQQVADDANPQAIASLIGPGKPLPDNITEDDDAVDAADDAFIEGIRIAMLVGFLVSLSALLVGWRLFPRGRETTSEELALEPG